MVLKANPAAAAAASATPPAGQFEGMDDDNTAVAEKPATAPAEAAAPAPAAAASTSRAVAAPTPTGMNIAQAARSTALKGLENQFELAALESLGNNVFPRITCGLEGFSVNKTKELGKRIQFEVISWNYVTLVSAGEQDDPEADKLVRSSYDHVNLKGNEGTVDEYVAKLKADGYERASSKKYIEIYANLVWSEQGGAVPVDQQTIHQLSVSPTSTGRWQAYLLQAGVNKAKGISDSNLVFATQEKVVNGNKKWGVAAFSLK